MRIAVIHYFIAAGGMWLRGTLLPPEPFSRSGTMGGGVVDMTEIVNLRLARKRKAREAREQGAVENRARFGRSRAEKEREAAERALEDARLRAHRREVEDDR